MLRKLKTAQAISAASWDSWRYCAVRSCITMELWSRGAMRRVVVSLAGGLIGLFQSAWRGIRFSRFLGR
jgi:hypothetical protein